MAINLTGLPGNGTTTASRVRQWLNKVAAATKLTVAASDASPAVITLAAHGLQSGDVVVGTGFTNNTNLNGGPFLVVWLSANTFKLTTLAGAAVNGGGSSADTGAGIQRVFVSLKPHDILNMHTTLSRQSYTKDSDAADPTYGNESTIQSLFSS